MTYKFMKDEAIADIAFVATGKSLNEMFESAGLAITNTMVKDLKSVKPKVKKNVKLRADKADKLLFDFLQEFVYWKDRSLLLFSKVKVNIAEKNGTYSLSAVLEGDKLNMKKHELLVDVKAVTYHRFSVEKKGNAWACHVILDV